VAKTNDGGRLLIGWASRDVTPNRPVMLRGQFYMRISQFVRDPLTVTALAIESNGEQCVMASVDHVTVPEPLIKGVRRRLAELAPDLDPKKVFISATHTHTAPHMLDPDSKEIFIGWEDPGPQVMSPQEYGEILIDRSAECIAEAWNSRKPGAIAFGMGYAVIGRNRRQVKKDGSALMYGDTSTPEFSHIEGYEDHSIQLLFTYDGTLRLTGMIVNVPCPAQVTEGHRFVSADYWHEARCEIRKRHGDRLFILPQCSAAGDQSPHVMFDKEAEKRMLKLKGYIDRADGDVRLAERMEIGNRIANAVDGVLAVAGGDIPDEIPLRHSARTIQLPRRRITKADVEEAQRQIQFYAKRLQELSDRPVTDHERSTCYGRRSWYERVIERYELQEREPYYPMELHVIRIGDLAFATNSFELYLDYGIRIKARSKAVQTFVVQLAGPGSYLPTARSVAGRSYGSEPASNIVGPEGGDVLIEETLKDIESLF